MSLIILAKRKSGGSYRVEFFQDKGRVRVRCSCSAGSVGQICRHKRSLISGSSRLLLNPEQQTLLNEILAWPEIRPLLTRARDYEKKLAVLESQKNELENQEQVLLLRFASDCLDGVHEE